MAEDGLHAGKNASFVVYGYVMVSGESLRDVLEHRLLVFLDHDVAPDRLFKTGDSDLVALVELVAVREDGGPTEVESVFDSRERAREQAAFEVESVDELAHAVDGGEVGAFEAKGLKGIGDVHGVAGGTHFLIDLPEATGVGFANLLAHAGLHPLDGEVGIKQGVINVEQDEDRWHGTSPALPAAAYEVRYAAATTTTHGVPMIEFTEEMRHAIKNALDDRNVCIVATASADGWPQLAFRGSVSVFSDNELSFWSRSRKDTVPNIEANPKVQIFYRNAAERIAWRFFGPGRNVTDPAEREAVMAVTDQRELDADPERKGIGTIVKIERIVDRTGAVIQQA